MARQLDKKQKGELADFLDRLYQLGGYSTQSSWAAEAKVHPVNLSNALNRKNLKGIDAFSLVSLLRAASDRIGSDPTDVAAAAATPRAVTRTSQASNSTSPPSTRTVRRFERRSQKRVERCEVHC